MFVPSTVPRCAPAQSMRPRTTGDVLRVPGSTDARPSVPPGFFGSLGSRSLSATTNTFGRGARIVTDASPQRCYSVHDSRTAARTTEHGADYATRKAAFIF